MAFCAGRVILAPEMANPTIVVLIDRDDLDEKLFGRFAPMRADDRVDPRKKRSVAAGGVVFTTIQNLLPRRRSDRRNILVVRRRYEAHRSQSDFIGGFARHMRDALPNLANEPVAALRRITLTLPPT